MARWAAAPLIVIPAMREWLVSTTGFLGGLFPTPLYHLHPCRRAFAGMTVGEIPGFGKMTEGEIPGLAGGYGRPRPPVPDLPDAGRRGSTTCIPVGVGRLFQTCLR